MQENDFCERIKFMGYISDVVWSPNAKQLAVIYSMSVALIIDPVSSKLPLSALHVHQLTQTIGQITARCVA